MGTRHLVCVLYEGKWVIVQYGQWDGYPSGQGLAILRFLKSPDAIRRLINGLSHVYIPTTAELGIIDKACDAMSAPGITDSSVLRSQVHRNAYDMFIDEMDPLNKIAPSISRDAGALILAMVADAGDGSNKYLGKPKENDESVANASAITSTENEAPPMADPQIRPGMIPIEHDLDFVTDGLFCEWAYVLDLDASTLGVYSGIHDKEPGNLFRSVSGLGDAPGLLCKMAISELQGMSEKEFLDRVQADSKRPGWQS